MNNDDSKLASLCKGGCGFYGSEIFNNMCSKCYKNSQMAKNSENVDSKDASTTTSSSSPTNKPALTHSISTSTTNTTTRTSTIATDITAASSRPSRKHRRSPSPVPEKKSPAATASPSISMSAVSPAAPSTSQPAIVAAVAAAAAAAAAASSGATGSSVAAATSTGNDHQRPPQLNKGKCYQCRAKVPLVKQTTNKCRCQYIFCDSHRYPDRHDCFIDFGKLDRAELAKNNPKLHERPAGGRSFRRIDSI